MGLAVRLEMLPESASTLAARFETLQAGLLTAIRTLETRA
jgi:hypothetical protein